MAIGFGIVGCGMISHFHARAIADVPGAKLVACFDAAAAAAERLAAAAGCRAYSSLPAMLADPAIDVVTIATPSGAHCEPAVAAAEAGKHVVVEKPLEITLGRCDRIIAACARSGVVLSTVFPSRFHAASVQLKRAVEQGRFGRLTVGDAYVKWFRSQEYYDSGAWRGTWELDGGGALMNQAIHSVDLLTWLMGPVVEVRAAAGLLAHERIAVEDVAVAAVALRQRGLGRHRGEHGGLSRLPQADRAARHGGLGGLGGRGPRPLGFCQGQAQRRGDPRDDGRPAKRRRRGLGPGCHRPPRPRPAIPRRPSGDQEGRARRRSTARKAAARWRSSWRSTSRRKRAGRSPCRSRGTRCSKPGRRGWGSRCKKGKTGKGEKGNGGKVPSFPFSLSYTSPSTAGTAGPTLFRPASLPSPLFPGQRPAILTRSSIASGLDSLLEGSGGRGVGRVQSAWSVPANGGQRCLFRAVGNSRRGATL